MRRTIRRKGGRKTRKGGLNIGPLVGMMKGCPAGKVRAFGGQCGTFRSGSGCCIDNTTVQLAKEKSFFGKVKDWFGGKSRKRRSRKRRRRKTHRK
jgi:hypothetical protein